MTEAGSRVRLPSIYRLRLSDAICSQPYLGPARSQPAPMHPLHNVCPIKEIEENLPHYIRTQHLYHILSIVSTLLLKAPGETSIALEMIIKLN